MALARRTPADTLIHHSDRGCQYISEAYTEVLESHGIRSSLSRPGNCWDNAVAESFFSTLKLDLLYRHSWPTRAAARSAVFEYIEAFYNRERRHSQAPKEVRMSSDVTAPRPKVRVGLPDRLQQGPVICAEGYLFECERRGYLPCWPSRL